MIGLVFMSASNIAYPGRFVPYALMHTGRRQDMSSKGTATDEAWICFDDLVFWVLHDDYCHLQARITDRVHDRGPN
jgi:hypothetical protein